MDKRTYEEWIDLHQRIILNLLTCEQRTKAIDEFLHSLRTEDLETGGPQRLYQLKSSEESRTALKRVRLLHLSTGCPTYHFTLVDLSDDEKALMA